MDKTALRHAWEALHHASAAHSAIVHAKSFGEVEREWGRFLNAANRIFSKLEKGSKDHGQAEPWFGRAIHDRRTDQLLRYVHHARNADEHGIKDITTRNASSITVSGGGFSAEYIKGEADGSISFEGVKSLNPDNPAVFEYDAPTVKLVTVFDDRFKGDSFDPPSEHLGQPLESGSIFEVTALTLKYLDGLVRDGSKFAK